MMDYSHLKNKKLLILGGNYETGLLVEVANELGIVTLVADPYPDSKSKKFAHKSFDVDVMNIDRVVEIALHEKVDGVLVGIADPLVGSYMKICTKLSLPCYVNEESFLAFTSKDGFVTVCEKFNIPTTPRYHIGDKNQFPVVVKPVDSGAGVGISICHNETELSVGVKFALDKSVKKEVIIEKYMQAEDVGVYYTFIAGEVFLSAMYDRHKSLKSHLGSPVCIGAIYPSKLLQEFLDGIHPKLVTMFKGLKIQNGVLNIQFFYENGNFYAYDPGFRLQGEAPHLHLKYANGFDHRKMLINFALTGKMSTFDFGSKNDVMLNKLHGLTVWVLLYEGIIFDIEGLEKIKTLQSYRDIVQRFQNGDEIEKSMLGTERQVFARIYLQNCNEDILKRDAFRVSELLKVTGSNTKSLIHDMFVFDGDFRC